MSVKRVQREVDSREFTEWHAFWQLEPWGEGRADLRTGILASTMANIWGSGDGEAFTPADFIPEFGTLAPAPMDRDDLIAQQQALLEGLTRAVGGEIR